MQQAPLSGLHKRVWTALFAALIAVGAMIQLPIGPVPVTLQTFFIILAGLSLGPLHGALAMLLYIGAGAIGLPVFAGGKAGFAHLLGPTGGYLVGFVFTAMLSGFGGGKKNHHILISVMWALAGLAAVYGLGMLRLMGVLDIPMEKAMAVGFAPFILGDLIKMVGSVAAYRFLLNRRLLP